MAKTVLGRLKRKIIQDALVYSVESNDKKLVEEIITEMNPDYNAKGLALEEAVYNNNLELAELLLKAGADPCYEDGKVLQNAIRLGYHEMVKLLIENNAQIPSLDQYSIITCAVRDWYNTIELFSQAGIDVNFNDGEALWWAIKFGNLKSAEILIKNASKESIANEKNLIAACNSGKFDIVRLMLEHGANPLASDGECLVRAAEEGHWHIVELLKNYGAVVTENLQKKLDDIKNKQNM